MLNNQIGTVEVISFRTSNRDESYTYPLEGVITGTSISHIALRLRFTDKALFDKYIANNPNIPYNDELIEKKTGTKMYEVYFSFWPSTKNVALMTEPSKLYNHRHDCEIAALETPMTYSKKYASYLRPQRMQIASMIPLLNYLIRDTVSLPPTLMFHTTRFKNTLDAIYSELPEEDKQSIVDSIIATSQEYALKYRLWFAANAAQISYSKSLCTNNDTTDRLSAKTQLAYDELLAYKEQFKNELTSAMFPNSDFSDDEFLDELEQFYTFGLPEMDVVTLPLVKQNNYDTKGGLDLEPMLRHIRNVANNPDKFQYSLFNFNCATVIRDILRKGVEDCESEKLYHAFDLPWYARWFSLPVSPAMVMHLATKAAKLSDMMKATPIICERCNTHKLQSTNVTQLKRRNACAPKINLEDNVEVLSSYKAKTTATIIPISSAKANKAANRFHS